MVFVFLWTQDWHRLTIFWIFAIYQLGLVNKHFPTSSDDTEETRGKRCERAAGTSEGVGGSSNPKDTRW